MATKKGNKSKKGVALSSRVEKLTTAIHTGVANALKTSVSGIEGSPGLHYGHPWPSRKSEDCLRDIIVIDLS